MNRSFQLIRTNPRLTTNIKIVVDSNYNLYFESFDSSKELSNEQYKHYLLNREAVIENEIPKFYNTLPKNLAFTPKSQFDADIMYNEYIQQFDSTYFAGANEVEDQWYKEEFEYFAPLYIKKGEVPNKFIILRVDEPCVYHLNGDEYVIGELNRFNFRNEIIDKWKCVSVFDLSNTTSVGKFFDRNINNNDRFPDFSFFLDTKKYNYSKWNGLEYQSGVYRVSELFLDDKLYYSNPHFNLEEFITKGFEDNGLIYPYILNMKFLFDDSPATPNEFTKWSMNRYYGFYAENFELVKCITSVEFPELKPGLTIKNNIFLSGNTPVNPYIIPYTTSKWVQIDNSFYEIRPQSNGSYKIISDINLTGYDVSTFNNGTCQISNKNGRNYISITSGITIEIDKFIDENGTESDLYADIYLIEIQGIYHILKKDNMGEYYIQTDYAIISDKVSLQYWKGGKNSEFSNQIPVINKDGSPVYYSIYRVKLSDIKDFDFDRIHTRYSDFDYEQSEYVDTTEEKLYAKEYRDISVPIRYKTHDKGEDGQFKVKNISSEYTAGDETFEIRGADITPIFEKNQSICKWAYDGSISHSDYPYKLNNSYSVGGVYNRTTNTNLKVANIKEKTLDYFYRIGDFYGKDVNDVVVGFTSNFQNDWVVEGGDADWVIDHIWLHNFGVGYDTIYMTLDIPLISNDLYSIDITANSAVPFGSYIMGIHPDSFINGTTTDTNNINISLVGRALSSGLTIFVTNATVELYTIKVTHIVNKYYLNQSTNIQTSFHIKQNLLNNPPGFNLKYYIDSKFDYFDFFFKNIMYYDDFGRIYEKTYQKYSIFNGGDGDLPSTTLFKGVEYKIYSVEDMVLNPPNLGLETIRNIITQGGRNYNGYKFSVILNDNYSAYNFNKTKTGDTYIYSDPTYLGYKNVSIYDPDNKLIKSSSDGIHVFLNDKYKNVLIIITKNIPINNEWGSLNNVDVFGDNYGLYMGKTIDNNNIYPSIGTTTITGEKIYNPDTLTASYYMDSLSNLNIKNVYDNYICYYYVDENCNFASTEAIKFKNDTGLSGFTSLVNWNNKFPLFYVETNRPEEISMKKNSYTVIPLKGPETNIYDKYLVYSERRPLIQSYIDEPLSRQINKYEVDETKNNVIHGESIYNTNTINRYIGYYEPIFKNLSMFKPAYFWQSGDTFDSMVGNYIFGDDLNEFGLVDELMYSKVNEYNNFLKLRNSDTERSYYPMIDEIGLSQTNRFIFLSAWDKNFYIKTLNEQTFLLDYVAVPEQIVISPSAAQIISSSVYSGLSIPYSSGIKIYGSLLGGTNICYQVTVKNLSTDAKTYNLKMYYKSTWLSTTKTELGSIGLVSPNSTVTIITNIQPRPPEIKSGQTSYEEYTRWDVYFEVYDPLESNTLDSKTSVYFNVYNDLINFNLINPSVQNGPTTDHTTGQMYWYSVDLSESNKKLPSVSYTATLSMSKYTGGDWLAKTLTQTMDTNPSNNETIQFTSVTLNRTSLDWPYSTTGNTTIKYYVEHNYEIEGITYKKTATNNTVTNYKIVGEVNPPLMEWYAETPYLSFSSIGTCDGSTYSGDNFVVTNIKVKNNGAGTYIGNLSLTCTFYIDGIESTIKYTNVYSVNVGAGSIFSFPNIPLGPKYPNDSPLITYKSSLYKAKVVITEIPSFKWTVTPDNPGIHEIEPCGRTLSIDHSNEIWNSTSMVVCGVEPYGNYLFLNVTAPVGESWYTVGNYGYNNWYFNKTSGTGSDTIIIYLQYPEIDTYGSITFKWQDGSDTGVSLWLIASPDYPC